MGAKAVYNNQSVMIYITGQEAAALLQNGSLILSCFIGSEYLSHAGCYVELAPEIVTEYSKQRQAEMDAIGAVRAQLQAAHPEMAKAASRRRDERRKRAKRTHSPDELD